MICSDKKLKSFSIFKVASCLQSDDDSDVNIEDITVHYKTQQLRLKSFHIDSIQTNFCFIELFEPCKENIALPQCSRLKRNETKLHVGYILSDNHVQKTVVIPDKNCTSESNPAINSTLCIEDKNSSIKSGKMET